MPGTSGRTGNVYDPATGAVTAEVDLASVEEVDAAVAVAIEAQMSWRASTLGERAHVLFAAREAVVRREHDLAAIITAQHGKTLADAAGEVQRALECIEFACGVPELLKGDFSPQVSGGVDVRSLRQPIGVVGCITPFNFPAMVPLWMVPNADRVRQRRRAQALRARSGRQRAHRGAVPRRGAPRWRPERRARRPGGREPDPRAPRHRCDQLRRLHPGGAPRVRDRHRARQARAGARRREEPHGGAPRCRPRPGRRRGGERGLWVGRRAVHGGERGRRRRRRRRRTGRRGAPSSRQAGHRSRHGPGLRDGAAHHRRAPRPRGVLRRPRRRRRRRGGRRWSRARSGP